MVEHRDRTISGRGVKVQCNSMPEGGEGGMMVEREGMVNQDLPVTFILSIYPAR
jgi:hypothetical protein